MRTSNRISGFGLNVVRLAVVVGLSWLFFRIIGSPASPPTPVRTGRVSVLSYNIQADSTRWSKTVDAILIANADVVCLQEVSTACFDHLRRELQHRYPVKLYRDSNYGFGGLAFFSKYKIRDQDYLPAEHDAWFPAWIVEADTPAGPVQILQVHLRPRIADVGGKVIGHLTVGSIHRREVAAYFDRLATGVPTLIVGDFNEENGAPAVRFLRKHDFTNALPLFDQDSHTWQGKVWGVKIKSRIDHIFFSTHFDCTEARVIHGGGSDHLPIRAAFMQRAANSSSTEE